MIILNIIKQIKLSKSNRPYASVAVQFDEYRDGKGNLRWISGFGNKRTWLWKKGDDVTAEITEKDGKYLNFSFDDTEENKLDVYKMPASIEFVMELLKIEKPKTTQPSTTTTQKEVEDEPNPEDIPF